MTRFTLGEWKDSKGVVVQAIMEVQEQKAGWYVHKARRNKSKSCQIGSGFITIKVSEPPYRNVPAIKSTEEQL